MLSAWRREGSPEHSVPDRATGKLKPFGDGVYNLFSWVYSDRRGNFLKKVVYIRKQEGILYYEGEALAQAAHIPDRMGPLCDLVYWRLGTGGSVRSVPTQTTL